LANNTAPVAAAVAQTAEVLYVLANARVKQMNRCLAPQNSDCKNWPMSARNFTKNTLNRKNNTNGCWTGGSGALKVNMQATTVNTNFTTKECPTPARTQTL